MIIDVNFRFAASIVPKGKRAAVTRAYKGSVPVEIPSLTDDEAPVALSFPGKGGTREDLRLVGDTLVRVMRNGDGDAGAYGLEWLVEHAERGYRTRTDDRDALGVCRLTHEKSEASIHDDHDVRTIVSTTETETAAEIRRRASRLFLVAGLLHEPSPEPVYVLGRGLPRVDGLPRLVAKFLPADQVDPRDIYRADEIDFALEGGMRAPPTADETILVLNADAVRHDAPGAEMRRAAEMALGQLKSGIAEGDEHLFAAYMDLRDAIRATEAAAKAGRGYDAEALVAPLRRAADGGHVTDFYLERATRALARVDARALSQFEMPSP